MVKLGKKNTIVIKNDQIIHPARHDRYDIYNNLPPGALSKIARKLKCSKTTVNSVLRGKIKDHHGIIPLGEKVAALWIWKQRFCRFKSEISDCWVWGCDPNELNVGRWKRKKGKGCN